MCTEMCKSLHINSLLSLSYIKNKWIHKFLLKSPSIKFHKNLLCGTRVAYAYKQKDMKLFNRVVEAPRKDDVTYCAKSICE